MVAHNTIHLPVFHRRWMNSVFQISGQPLVRLPVSDYLPGHNLAHHRFLQAREDVMVQGGLPLELPLESGVFVFRLVTPGILSRQRALRKAQGQRVAWRRQLRLETGGPSRE